jgi:hypothetical protein
MSVINVAEARKLPLISSAGSKTQVNRVRGNITMTPKFSDLLCELNANVNY